MPTTKQRRQSARRRLLRQLDRRREAARQRRQRNLIILVVCAVVVVLLGGTFTVLQFTGDDDDGGNQAAGTDDPTPADTREPLPARTPESKQPREPQATEGPCGYAENEQTVLNPNTFDVGLPPDPDPTPSEGTVNVTMTTNVGDVQLALDRAAAPCTVQSFVYLAEQGFFDNTACPRAVDQGIFVVQCGDPTATGRGGPTYTVKDENLQNAIYGEGALAMANSGPNTNGSQFFMIFADSAGGLEKNYTVFGKVTEGLDIVAQVGAGGNDGSNPAGGGRPEQDFILEKVTINK